MQRAKHQVYNRCTCYPWRIFSNGYLATANCLWVKDNFVYRYEEKGNFRSHDLCKIVRYVQWLNGCNVQLEIILTPNLHAAVVDWCGYHSQSRQTFYHACHYHVKLECSILLGSDQMKCQQHTFHSWTFRSCSQHSIYSFQTSGNDCGIANFKH